MVLLLFALTTILLQVTGYIGMMRSMGNGFLVMLPHRQDLPKSQWPGLYQILTANSFFSSEDLYVDFKREHLVPHSLLAEGPALVVDDLNGDEMEDLFVGGAKGQVAYKLWEGWF
jgi:hypothetical protein